MLLKMFNNVYLEYLDGISSSADSPGRRGNETSNGKIKYYLIETFFVWTAYNFIAKQSVSTAKSLISSHKWDPTRVLIFNFR